MDAVEVYQRSARLGPDARRCADVVAEADRGTGTIICNVQRYNPSPTQLLS